MAGRLIPENVQSQDLLAAYTQSGLQNYTLCVQAPPSSGRERMLISARSCYYHELSPSFLRYQAIIADFDSMVHASDNDVASWAARQLS